MELSILSPEKFQQVSGKTSSSSIKQTVPQPTPYLQKSKQLGNFKANQGLSVPCFILSDTDVITDVITDMSMISDEFQEDNSTRLVCLSVVMLTFLMPHPPMIEYPQLPSLSDTNTDHFTLLVSYCLLNINRIQ